MSNEQMIITNLGIFITNDLFIGYYQFCIYKYQREIANNNIICFSLYYNTIQTVFPEINLFKGHK